jgi:hypothetical protein
MDIKPNTESAWDEEFSWEPNNLSQKLFSETVCKDCESTPITQTDNMGREKFWEDLGRPIDFLQ